MTKEQKKDIIVELMSSLQREALAAVDKMPENWDGHEIRSYLADKFGGEVSALMNPQSTRRDRRRIKEYRNTLAITGGL